MLTVGTFGGPIFIMMIIFFFAIHQSFVLACLRVASHLCTSEQPWALCVKGCVPAP